MFIEKIYNDFQTYVYTNKILSASGAFVFGMISKDLIDKLLNEIIFPLILSIIMLKDVLKNVEKDYPIMYLCMKLIWIIVVWSISILFSFIILEYVLNRKILGLSSTVISKENKNDYLEMKVNAKMSGIIPDEKELKEIEKEKEIIERKINERYMNIEEFI